VSVELSCSSTPSHTNCRRRPILGGKTILGADLFLERKIYFWSMCHRWRKSSMKKEEKQCGAHAKIPNHATVRVFYMNVMDINQ
jgi:hypothetical protein